jgi:hypothetical protein
MLNALFGLNPSCLSEVDDQPNDYFYRTNGRVKTVVSVNLTIIRRTFAVVTSSARSRPISSARSRSLHIVRRIPSLTPFDLPLGLFTRSALFRARPRRPLDFVSRWIDCLCIGTRETVLNLLLRVAADRRTDARAPPRTVNSISAALSPVLRTASASSGRRLLEVAALLLRGHRCRRLPRSPPCCSLCSLRETPFRRSKPSECAA